MCIPAIQKFSYKICADFFYPFINVTSKIENFATSVATQKKSRHTLIVENTNLIKMICTLTAKYRHLEKLKEENKELRQLLKLQEKAYYNYVFAEIINRDPIDKNEHFVLNKGKADGIEEGAIVIAAANLQVQEKIMNADALKFGVVGRIGSVSKHTSTVHTVINEECKLGVFIPDNNAAGILDGGGRTGNTFWSEIKFLPRDLKYVSGTIVETSGKSNAIPSGLLIGTIMGNDSPAISVYNELYAVAKIKPIINLDRLNFVLVLGQKND